MGSGIKFDEIETDKGTCLPTHVAVSVCLYDTNGLKVKNYQTLEQLYLFLYWMLSASNFSKSVSISSKTIFGELCLTRSLQVTKCRPRIPVFEKNVSDVVHLKALDNVLMLLT